MTEFVPENDVINVKESAMDGANTDHTTPTAAAAADGKPPINADRKKKKSGAFGIFRAALFILRKRPGEKAAAKKAFAKQNSTASNTNNWAKLFGSMRPLSLQETAQSPPRQPSSPVADAVEEETIQLQEQSSTGVDDEMIVPPVQKESSVAAAESIMEETIPAPASPAASSSCGTMSQYASATSLRDLYNSSDDEEEEEEEDPDEVFDAICGDEMIDAKAEEFIAQFYKQLQLQKTTAKTHHHHYRGI